jgi:molybdopterin-guanine dinucleotide biosynthesis protein A
MTSLFPVSAAVLAGGASRRMGRDKALLPFRGEPLLQSIIRRLSIVFRDPFVVSGDPGRYPFLDCPIVPDRVAGKGPLAGIDAALRHAAAPFVFVCGCDMPFLSEALLRHLAGKAGEGFDLVLPFGPDGPQPLCAVWGKTALPEIESALAQNRLSVIEMAKNVTVLSITSEEVASVDPGFSSFRNVNTPDDARSI